ncbi:MAG: methyltransferase domain-containing protein [Nitrospira sp.]|nr:methyltransferase domain-containing protein [Nitrospira sp.]
MIDLLVLREYEFNEVCRYFQPGQHVLEIGGGNGWQASLMASRGLLVQSIDVTLPQEQLYHPVRLYDGRILPYDNEAFDIVYSSNVLEHVRDVAAMQKEIHRVLRADGCAIHILPTPAWRFWTSLAHYLYGVQHSLKLLRGFFAQAAMHTHELPISSKARGRGAWYIFRRMLAAGPHGEYPSAISELWYFSRRRWLNLLQQNGFELVDDWALGLFYTGYGVCPKLSIMWRRRLAALLGSATHVFVLRKTS